MAFFRSPVKMNDPDGELQAQIFVRQNHMHQVSSKREWRIMFYCFYWKQQDEQATRHVFSTMQDTVVTFQRFSDTVKGIKAVRAYDYNSYMFFFF